MRRHRDLRFFTRPKRQTSRRPLGLRRRKSSTPSTHVTADRSRPCFSQSSLRILVTSPTSPDPTEETKTSGAEQSWQKKKGEDARTDGRPNSFRIFRCRSRRDTRRTEKTNFKMAPNFFPLRRRSRCFHSPLAGRRESESAHAASPSALLSFFHFHFLLFFLLDLPPEGFPLYSRSLHLHFC